MLKEQPCSLECQKPSSSPRCVLVALRIDNSTSAIGWSHQIIPHTLSLSRLLIMPSSWNLILISLSNPSPSHITALLSYLTHHILREIILRDGYILNLRILEDSALVSDSCRLSLAMLRAIPISEARLCSGSWRGIWCP